MKHWLLLFPLPVLLVVAHARPAHAQPARPPMGSAGVPGPAPANRPVVPPPARAASRPALAGTYTGSLAVPGKMLSIGLVIAESNGRLGAVLETPVVQLSHHALTLTQRHDTLTFYDRRTEARYVCQRAANGLLLIGQWQQPGFREALVLRREAEVLAPVRTTHTTRWESGDLENGRRVGLWHYYRYAPDGLRLLAQTYDHSAGQLLFARADDETYEAETSPGQWVSTKLTQAPWFIGGREALGPFASTVRYPAAALKDKVAGQVTVSFVVDTLGRVANHRVVQGLGHGCDEEALRVARTIPGTWTPGRVGPRAVAVVYYLSFLFRLP